MASDGLRWYLGLCRCISIAANRYVLRRRQVSTAENIPVVTSWPKRLRWVKELFFFCNNGLGELNGE